MRGVDRSIYEDARYADIGDTLTGFAPYAEKHLGSEWFDTIYLRSFEVRELALLYRGIVSKNQGLSHIIRAVNMCCSCDVNQLTDGDFEFIMTLLRQNSFPKAPALVNWTCKKTNVVFVDGRAFYKGVPLSEDEMTSKGLVYEVCDAAQAEIVHNIKLELLTLNDDDLEIPFPELDFPRVKTMMEFLELAHEAPENKFMLECARWIKEGNTLAEKVELLNSASLSTFCNIQECKIRYKHGVVENMRLRCRTCGNEVPHASYPDPTTFFASNSDKSIMDIQYALQNAMGMQPDDNMPAKRLLYHYSCWTKDKQAEQERENLRKAVSR